MSIDPRIAMRLLPGVTPSVCQIDTETNEPIMKTSPWAKLISSMMP